MILGQICWNIWLKVKCQQGYRCSTIYWFYTFFCKGVSCCDCIQQSPTVCVKVFMLRLRMTVYFCNQFSCVCADFNARLIPIDCLHPSFMFVCNESFVLWNHCRVSGDIKRNPHCIRSSLTLCDLSNSLTDLNTYYTADVLSKPPLGATSDLTEFPYTSSPKFCPYKDSRSFC